MELDFSPFERALASLDRAARRSIAEPDDEEVRDAVIQRFEYTYEMAWRMLKRVLAQEAATPADTEALSFRELIREGARRGLVRDVERWLVYRERRNITSHTYDERKARAVHAAALEFRADAAALLAALKERS